MFKRNKTKIKNRDKRINNLNSLKKNNIKSIKDDNNSNIKIKISKKKLIFKNLKLKYMIKFK